MKTSLKIFIVLLTLSSCTKGMDSLSVTEDTSDAYSVSHEEIVLGAKLDDPYAVDNMRDALRSLYPTKAGRVSVEATDLYVRFLPKNNDEYDRLVKLGVEMYDHPLDYEILKDGDYYHDPKLASDQITWQYAVVKSDFILPSGIRYEVCDSCFIPNSDLITRASDGIDWAEVEKEAFRLTGNGDMINEPVKGGEPACPAGRITIVDDEYDDGQPVGVAGVTVSVNTFVKFSTAYTDADGFYQIPRSYSTDVRYRLVFKNRKGFAIGFNLVLVPASTSALGVNSQLGLDLTVDKNSDRKLFSRCVVNNAAWEYFEMCEDDLMPVTPPPTNLRFWIFQNLNASSALFLHQGVLLNMDLVSNLLGIYKILVQIFMPDITLGLSNCSDYADIYATAVHEMAHASHFMNTGQDYWMNFMAYVLKSFIATGQTYGNGSGSSAGHCEIGEMWAYYLENQLYRLRYGRRSPNFMKTYWFSPQILENLDERGMNRSMINGALTSGVTSVNELEKQLTALYPEDKKMIEQVFDRYLK